MQNTHITHSDIYSGGFIAMGAKQMQDVLYLMHAILIYFFVRNHSC